MNDFSRSMEQKMYWKNGFYDEPQDGAVEISVEYLEELLKGQSSGKQIVENEDGYPILVEYEYDIEELREMKVSDIQRFDKSETVNSFIFQGKTAWLDKSTRVGLFNSISVEERTGKTDTVLWMNGVKYTIPIPEALTVLEKIELYALNCYNVTQGHIVAVRSMKTVEEIEVYDFKTGYPSKLNFSGYPEVKL